MILSRLERQPHGKQRFRPNILCTRPIFSITGKINTKIQPGTDFSTTVLLGLQNSFGTSVDQTHRVRGDTWEAITSVPGFLESKASPASPSRAAGSGRQRLLEPRL